MHFRFPTSRYTSPIKQKYNPSHIICPRLSKDASKHEKIVNEMGSFFALLFALLLRQEGRDGRAAFFPTPVRVLRKAENTVCEPCCPQGENTTHTPRPPRGGKYGTWTVPSARRKIRYTGCVLRQAENTVREPCYSKKTAAPSTDAAASFKISKYWIRSEDYHMAGF